MLKLLFNNSKTYDYQNSTTKCIDKNYDYSNDTNHQCFLSLNDCIGKGYKIFNNQCYIEFPKNTELDENGYSCSKNIINLCDNEKCSLCDNNSQLLDLCLECNEEKKYYPMKSKNNYVLCSSCKKKEILQKLIMILCIKGYIFEQENKNSKYCLQKCDYFFYYFNNHYICTQYEQCPLDNNLIIKNIILYLAYCNNEDLYKF